MMKLDLPIDRAIPSIIETVERHPITIIQAPPGSGKTTRVAPALLASLSNSQLGRIYLLQPRRLAARSVAQRIAQENQWTLGQEVGYQVRFEQKYQRDTRLIVATEGILLRRLQSDATLSQISVVLLDEFHELSLDADLLLGMLRQVQESVRGDLRIVIMSATLNADELSCALGNAPALSVEGQMFPVSLRYRPPAFRENIVDTATSAVLHAAERDQGDILVFLPGQGEIHRVRDRIEHVLSPMDVYGLYGSLPLDEQSRIIAPGPRRKIVLSTNIAETSLTIEGIQVVIDSGLARVLRFDPSVGLDRLSLEPIAQDAATQRMGRAGRITSGTCYRLWDEASHRSRPASLEPEVRRVDLASAILQLHQWGHTQVETFPWLTPPRHEAVDAALKLLHGLGAIQHGQLTAVGMKLASLPLHPRLGRLVVAGHEAGELRRTCMVAALLSERDPFLQRSTPSSHRKSPPTSIATHGTRRWSSDVVARLELIENHLAGGPSQTVLGELNRSTVQTITRTATEIESMVEDIQRSSSTTVSSDTNLDTPDMTLMRCLLQGFPDRVAKRRSLTNPAALMVGGRAVQLAPTSGVHASELFLCIDVDTSKAGPNAIVRQASTVDERWLDGPMRTEREELFFHPSQQQVVARRRVYWDDLLLNETPMAIENQSAASELLFRSALAHWNAVFPAEDEELSSLIERCRWLKAIAPECDLPSLDQAALAAICRDLCESCRSFAELKKAPWRDWILGRFSSEQTRLLDREAPRRMQVPSGASYRLHYETGKVPVLAVKIQEVFSWSTTPKIAFGRVPVLLHLLAPNQRPQQITDDLASFWTNGYPLVKKELKRRYPKHAWPDDPQTASPPIKRPDR